MASSHLLTNSFNIPGMGFIGAPLSPPRSVQQSMILSFLSDTLHISSDVQMWKLLGLFPVLHLVSDWLEHGEQSRGIDMFLKITRVNVNDDGVNKISRWFYNNLVDDSP